MRSGKQIVRFGIVALMLSCLGVAGCNRHQAHDDDDDDSDSAPAAAGTAAAAPQAPASAATSVTDSAGSMSQAATTPPTDQGASAPAEPSSSEPASAVPEPASEPAPVEAAPAKHQRAARTVASTNESMQGSASSKHSAATPVAWWTASASSPLSVLAVGPAAGMSGIVVLTSKDLGDAVAAGQHIKVVREGKTVSGSWHAGANGRVLVLDSLKPGRYELTIDGDLASSDGQKLGTRLHGPVYVR